MAISTTEMLSGMAFSQGDDIRKLQTKVQQLEARLAKIEAILETCWKLPSNVPGWVCQYCGSRKFVTGGCPICGKE